MDCWKCKKRWTKVSLVIKILQTYSISCFHSIYFTKFWCLCLSSTEDIVSVIEPNVTTKKNTLKELDSKVSDRKEKLHEILTSCQTSEKTLDDLLHWLRANDKAMKALKPMSENMDILLQLRDFYEV